MNENQSWKQIELVKYVPDPVNKSMSTAVCEISRLVWAKGIAKTPGSMMCWP